MGNQYRQVDWGIGSGQKSTLFFRINTQILVSGVMVG